MQSKKLQLEEEVLLCEQRHARASQLIGGLASEKIRWIEVEAQMVQDLATLEGDVLLSCACVAYLGAFTAPYRYVFLT